MKIQSSVSSYYDDKIEKRKNDLINCFDMVINGQKSSAYSNLKPTIYSILVDSFNSIKKQSWVNDDIMNYYNKSIKDLHPVYDNNWANFIPRLSKEDFDFFRGDGNQTYNIYYTFLFSSLEDVQNFIGFIKFICDDLYNGQIIGTDQIPFFTCKTHANFNSLITHNDTFKVFYYDKQLKDRIKRYIQDCISHFHLKKSDRPYDYGKDIKENLTMEEIFGLPEEQYIEKDKNFGSFGERLSKHIAKEFINKVSYSIKNHKVTSEQCYNYFKRQFYKLVINYSQNLS